MEKVILDSVNYNFDASAKTITFTQSYGTVELNHVLLITNVTDNVIIYNFGCTGYGGSMSGLTLTLDYDTTSMADTDDLQVVLYVESTENSSNMLKELEVQSETLSCLQNILEELKLNNKLIKEILR